MLNDFNYSALAISDVHVSESHLYVQQPTYRPCMESGIYEEVICVFSHPKNMGLALEMVEKHNQIYNSPLMKALREA